MDSKVSSEGSYPHIPMAERPRLIQALHSEHRYMASLLDALEEQVALLLTDDGADINLILDIVHYMKSFPDRFHHPREDIVYELLAEREKSIRALLLDLRREHPELERLAAEVVDSIEDVRILPTKLKRERAIEVSTDYIEMLRRHMDQEEAGVLPIASVVLDQEDWDDIEARAARYEEIPADSVVADQYDAIRQRVSSRIEGLREDLLLAEFLGTTTFMEMAGAMARGVVDINRAVRKGASASLHSYTEAWKSVIPGLESERNAKDQWVDTWETLQSGVKQVSEASKILREQTTVPGQSGWRLYGKVVKGVRRQAGSGEAQA